MTYEKPEIRDFGDIARHTYVTGDDADSPNFLSFEPCDKIEL